MKRDIVLQVLKGIALVWSGSGNGEIVVVLHERNTYRVGVTDKGQNRHLTPKARV